MSNLTRKGTVSRASGPTHSTSYAMRGVPVRYKTPIFVPELLQLPGDWVQPTLPSSRFFNYNYSLERRVSEQARHRAISIAAEASLQRKQIQALLEQQKVGVSSESSEQQQPTPNPPPLLPFSTDILTPTPATPPTSQGSPTVGGSATPCSSGGEGGGSSSSLIEEDNRQASGSDQAGKKDESAFKSLGNWSIREFEGDAMDPFEIASLQAINDMEVLQSVLQPSVLPKTAVATVAATTAPVAATVVPVSSSTPAVFGVGAPQLQASTGFSNTSSSSSVVQSSPSPTSTTPAAAPNTTTTATTATPLPQTNTMVPPSAAAGIPSNSQIGTVSAAAAITPSWASSSNPDLKALPSMPAQVAQRKGSEGTLATTMAAPYGALTQAQFNFQPSVQVSVNPFLSGLATTATTASTTATRGSTNPFAPSEPASNQQPFTALMPGSAAPVTVTQSQQQQPQLQERESGAGVGTLVDLNPIQPKPPVPTPRISSPKRHSAATPPVPKPRKGSPAPSARGVAQPPAAATTPTPTQVAARPPPGPPPAGGGFQTRGVGNSSPKFSPRVSMGVSVLPPIAAPPTSSSSSTSSATPSQATNDPPPYKLKATPPTARKLSPPPPYSSPTPNHRPQPQPPAPAATPPQVARKTYVLLNPEASLTVEQRKTVETIAVMGFPPQRVGRALLRFKEDQSKVLDFLFLVGELEEAKFDGNSAETALIACKDNLGEAKEYLQKLEGYKEIGFQEKAIHSAFTQTNGDWDKALDILTKSR